MRERNEVMKITEMNNCIEEIRKCIHKGRKRNTN
nr:MAG TPA: hypothetical protein [Bacteriophage sp.]